MLLPKRYDATLRRRGHRFSLLLGLSLLALVLGLSSRLRPAQAGMTGRSPTRFSIINYKISTEVIDIAFAGNEVWSATINGVIATNRTTGSHSHFTSADGLAAGWYTSILAATDGSIWAGSIHDGLFRYRHGQWQAYTTAHGLDSNDIRSLAQHPNGTIYVATDRSIERFDGTHFTNWAPAPTFVPYVKIAFDLDGYLWAGTSDEGTYRISGSGWTYFGSSDTGPGGAIRDIAVDPITGAVWFAMSSNGFGRWTPTSWQRFTAAQGAPQGDAQAVTVTQNGQVWAAAMNFGGGTGAKVFGRFTGGSWLTYDFSNGLGFGVIRSVEADPAGNIWLGVKGVTRFDGVDFKLYADGMLHTMNTMSYAPDGSLWFGLDSFGLGHFSDPGWELYTWRDLGTPSSNGGSIGGIAIMSNGHVWIKGSWAGLAHFDGVSWEHLSLGDGIPFELYEAISAAPNDDLWLISEFSLIRYDGHDWTVWSDVLPNNRARRIIVSGSDIWIGYSEYQNAGLTHFDGTTFTHYTTADGLPHNDAQLLGRGPDGKIWVKTPGTLSSLDGATWTNYAVGDFLPADDIDRGAVDAEGNVWFTFLNSPLGIGIFDGTDWQLLDTSDGLLTNLVRDIIVHPNGLQAFVTYEIGPAAPQDGARILVLDSLTEPQFLPLVARGP